MFGYRHGVPSAIGQQEGSSQYAARNPQNSTLMGGDFQHDRHHSTQDRGSASQTVRQNPIAMPVGNGVNIIGSFGSPSSDPEGPGRILCVADIRGNISKFNELARLHKAQAIIHVGDLGFLDDNSIEDILDSSLRWKVAHSPLLTAQERDYLSRFTDSQALRQALRKMPFPCLSMLPSYLSGKLHLDVPVYTIYGFCEDVKVLEKFRRKTYNVTNLHIVDEANAGIIHMGSLRLRLLGLGGPFIPNKLLDHGYANSTIAGTTGQLWITMLQIGELLQTAGKLWHSTETRVFLTQGSPSHDSSLLALAGTLQCDFTISGGLHFRYGSVHNEASVSPEIDMRGKCERAAAIIEASYALVRGEIGAQASPRQRELLELAFNAIRLPTSDNVRHENGTEIRSSIETIYRNIWHINLPDEGIGSTTLIIADGRLSLESRSSGTAFGYRRGLLPPSATPATRHPEQSVHSLQERTSMPSITSTSPGITKSRPQFSAPERHAYPSDAARSNASAVEQHTAFGPENGTQSINQASSRTHASTISPIAADLQANARTAQPALSRKAGQVSQTVSLDGVRTQTPEQASRSTPDDIDLNEIIRRNSAKHTRSGNGESLVPAGQTRSSDIRMTPTSSTPSSPRLEEKSKIAQTAKTNNIRTLKVNGLAPDTDTKLQFRELYGSEIADKILVTRVHRKVPSQAFLDVRDTDIDMFLGLSMKPVAKLEHGLEITNDKFPLRVPSVARARPLSNKQKSKDKTERSTAPHKVNGSARGLDEVVRNASASEEPRVVPSEHAASNRPKYPAVASQNANTNQESVKGKATKQHSGRKTKVGVADGSDDHKLMSTAVPAANKGASPQTHQSS